MTFVAQLEANPANAQKSSGPKTEKGKHRTRLNAYRHGLTGQICLLTSDEHQAFDQHCASVPCGPSAKPPVNRRSKRPNCLPSLHIPRARSTIRRATFRPSFCKSGLIFRPPV
jgi:hypothetical protein